MYLLSFPNLLLLQCERSSLLCLFDVAWSGIGLRFIIATNTATALVIFTSVGLSRGAWFFTNCSSPFLGFVFSRVNSNCVALLFFLVDRFSFLSWNFHPISKQNYLLFCWWIFFPQSCKIVSLMFWKLS